MSDRQKIAKSQVVDKCVVEMASNINNWSGKSPRELTKDQLLSLVIRCTDFAAKKHRKQRRLDEESTPYINHPIGNKKNH